MIRRPPIDPRRGLLTIVPGLVLAVLVSLPTTVSAAGQGEQGLGPAPESSELLAGELGSAALPAAQPTAFRTGKWKPRKVPWRHLRLNGGTLTPVKTVGPQDDKGIPMRPFGPRGSLVYNPTVLAQQGMKRLDAWKRTGKKVHLREARKLARKLDGLASDGKRRHWLPHPYTKGVHKKGWVNSNSHGLVLSFFSRLHEMTGSKGRLKKASLLLPPYARRPDSKRWFSTVTPKGYIWFEHWPGGRFQHTLNAHINALFGLYDYWAATGSPEAERYFRGGVKTVRDKLRRFRRKGNLSRYSLSSKAGSLHYHQEHIGQLSTLAKMTGDKWFARQARLLRQDELIWRANGKRE